ncbi:hypothetical protein Tco_0658739 [Tanacetum coccineum]
MKRGYAGDFVPLLPAMLEGAAMDQGEGSAQPAEPYHTPVDPIPSTSQPPHSPPHSPPYSPHHSSPPRSYKAPLSEGNVVVKLVKKMKSLETALKRKSKKVIVSESENEEPEDQGRIIQDIDDNLLVSLVRESIKMKEKSTDFVTPTKASGEAHEEDISPTILEAAKTLSKVASQDVSKVKSTDKGKRYRRRARVCKVWDDWEVDRYGNANLETMMIDKDVPSIGEKVAENAQGDSETDKEESVEAMNPTPLAIKSNIVVNWKIFQQGQRSIYQIMRANRADTVYMSFGAMIKDFTIEDLIELYRLVMQKYGTNRPEDAYDRVLWSDLRTMFDPPLNEDAIWSLPLQQKMYCTKALATPEQTATGKENSNPLIADSLLKTISCDEEKTKTKRQKKLRM